ncbi:hypothetical protein ACULMC_11470 [Xanthomonas arboricola pv. corylina]|uniref:hypothetical protein n=1 Tax=Xanthomonas TaxID=338 RepID=UPI0011AFD3A7|nr:MULTISPECIES: hypothetical protein [Xanthomonas]MCE4361624.1 hypothetical protein [Xanthomonas hortorum]
MGIIVENQEWAANADKHGEAMYKKTNNPYYLIKALAAARLVNWEPPAWALAPLLDAVKDAYFDTQDRGKDLSIDARIGLKPKRGGVRPLLASRKSDVEANVFRDINLIRACFDVSIPDICELIHSAIAFDFSRSYAEIISGAWEMSDDHLKSIGMSREQHDDAICRSLERDAEIINDQRNSPAIRKKLENFDFYSISTGLILGYGCETLIEKFYRRDKSDDIIPTEGTSEYELIVYFDGYRLLNSGTCRRSCLDSVPISMHGPSQIDRLPYRDGFASHVKRFNQVRHPVKDTPLSK